MHIAQISYDDTVFQDEAPSDTMLRQEKYRSELLSRCSGSRLTLVVITRKPISKAINKNNLFILPLVCRSRFFIPLLLVITLIHIHTRYPINVLSPQTLFEDGWGCILFSKFFKVPVVGQIHYDFFSQWGKLYNAGNGILGEIRQFIAIRCMKNYQKIRSVGIRVSNEIAARELHSSVVVLPVPVRMPISFDEINIKSKHEKCVLFVGRLVPEKNLEEWLKVACIVRKNVPNVKFKIVGDGPVKQRIIELADQSNLTVDIEFTGYIAHEDLGSIYQSASLLLLTSMYEGFGRVAVEAYQYGLPVVAPKICGVEDIVEDGISGFLLKENDIQGMAEAVQKLLSNDDLRRSMGKAGCSIVKERFDPDTLTKKWIDVLVSVGKRK